MANRLRPIPEAELPEFAVDPAPQHVTQAAPPESALQAAATSILFTSLKALSQRTIVALSNLFVLAAAASAFWLWYVTLPNPSVPQLVGLGLYGLLMLALVHLVLQRR
jgi:hypothetical protein